MRAATQAELQCGLLGFIEVCVVGERKERFIGFSRSAKGLKKWVAQLDHFQNYLDINHSHQISLSATGKDLIEHYGLVAQSEVLVLSTLRGMQGVVLPLPQAIEETYGMGNGAILCSLNPIFSFWFYFGEEAHAQYVFMKQLPAIRKKPQ